MRELDWTRLVRAREQAIKVEFQLVAHQASRLDLLMFENSSQRTTTTTMTFVQLYPLWSGLLLSTAECIPHNPREQSRANLKALKLAFRDSSLWTKQTKQTGDNLTDLLSVGAKRRFVGRSLLSLLLLPLWTWKADSYFDFVRPPMARCWRKPRVGTASLPRV